MRTAFIETLYELARTDARIMLVVGDLGFGVVTRFAEDLPRQFVNAGVSEQSMAGLAAGMALEGRIVFTYSIANFPVIRCLEQIRNDICYHDLNVKVVAVGGGMVYGALGASHFATEDLALLRAMPGMTVVAPNDARETAEAVRALVCQPGPGYLRISRGGDSRTDNPAIPFELGKAILIREGGDAAILATGGMLQAGLQAAEQLDDEGIRCRVLSFHTVKPLDKLAVRSAASETGAVLTLEEHSVVGGFGSAVAETILESGISLRVFRRIGLPDRFPDTVGGHEYLKKRHGLDGAGVAVAIRKALASVTEG